MNIKLIILLIFGISADCYSQISKTTKLSGTLKNFDNQVEITDMSEFENLKVNYDNKFIIPDSTGAFSVSINLDSAGYFKIGRNILYLSPGDNLSIFIDYTDPKLAKFSGQGSKSNNYLKDTPFPKGGSFLEAGDNIQGSLLKTLAKVELLGENRKRILSDIQGVSNQFKMLELVRIQADILNSLKDIDIYYPYVHKLKEDSIAKFNQEYQRLIQPVIVKYSLNLLSSQYLCLEVYRSIASLLLEQSQNDTSVNKKLISEWILASKLVRRMKLVVNKTELKTFAQKIDSVSFQPYKKLVRKSYNDLLNFGNGDDVIDFYAMDQTGKQMTLEQFKGKIIYIELWATWCGPCVQESSFLEVLKTQFIQNKNIVFISLSIDDNKQAWKNSLKYNNSNGNQWIINRKKLNSYFVSGVPRSIIIDSNFKILKMQGMLPSNKALKHFLESELDKTIPIK